MPTTIIRLHRVLRATPERVYRAFLDADAMVKWLPPNGFTGKVHHLDARIGGTYKMSFTNFTTGQSHSFGGEYPELAPYERIRHTDKFDDPNLPGVMQTTVPLEKVFCGTEVNVVQEGVPDSIPPRLAISGGRNRSRCWRNSSKPRFRGSEVTPNNFITRPCLRHAAYVRRQPDWIIPAGSIDSEGRFGDDESLKRGIPMEKKQGDERADCRSKKSYKSGAISRGFYREPDSTEESWRHRDAICV